jgi:alpha-tubulin suppressor-like RCC1 family protein
MLIKTDGTLWTCGRNENGSLGLNLPIATYRSSPVQVGSGNTWLKVLGGAYKTLAISST